MSLKYKDNWFLCMVGNLWEEYDIHSSLETGMEGTTCAWVLFPVLAQNSPTNEGSAGRKMRDGKEKMEVLAGIYAGGCNAGGRCRKYAPEEGAGRGERE